MPGKIIRMHSIKNLLDKLLARPISIVVAKTSLKLKPAAIP